MNNKELSELKDLIRDAESVHRAAHHAKHDLVRSNIKACRDRRVEIAGHLTDTPTTPTATIGSGARITPDALSFMQDMIMR